MVTYKVNDSKSIEFLYTAVLKFIDKDIEEI